MSNLSSASSNSPKHSLGSFESASCDHPPSPPPNPMHPPILFPIHSLPPQVFIPEEVASFNWSDREQEDSEELRWRLKKMLRMQQLLHSWTPPSGAREGEDPLNQAWSPTLQSLLTLRSQIPLTVPLMAPLTQGMLKTRKKKRRRGRRKRRKRRWSIKLQIILERTLGMTRILMRHGLLELLTIRFAVLSLLFLFYFYFYFYFFV